MKLRKPAFLPISSDIGAVVAICLFAVSGTVLFMHIRAASPVASMELETGTITAPATKVTDGTASGGSAVKFNSPAVPSGFVHPGIFLSRADLDFVKAKVAVGQQPWTAAKDKAASFRYGSLTYTPHPVASVQCGNGSSTLKVGCSDQLDDGAAAYTQALLWYYTGNKAYANKAIQIINAWSSTLTSMPWDGTSKYGNNKLQAGWSGTNFIRAAEILRYSNTGWTTSDIDQFESMLTTIYLPLVQPSWTGGGFNWVMLFADTTMDIGVFTDNKTVYNSGLKDWRSQVKGQIYLSSDGAGPLQPGSPVPAKNATQMDTYWHMQAAWNYQNGQNEETCRDVGHSAMGLASTAYAAETARIQGTDLYNEEATRIKAAIEYQAAAIAHLHAKDANAAYVIPSTFCGGALNWGGTAAKLTGEVSYNHYAGRLGQPLPATLQFLNWYRPIPTAGIGNLHMQWETLTSYGTASAD